MDKNTETLRKQFADPNFPTVREIVDVCRAYAESEGVLWPEWPEDDWLEVDPGFPDQAFDLNLWTDDETDEPFITYYVVNNHETDTSFGITISVYDFYFIVG